MGLYCVNGGASHEYEDAAAPILPSTSSACVDRQVINGYELCKVEFPGGCSDRSTARAPSVMTGCRSETTGGVARTAIGIEIAAVLKMAFEAIWTPPGRLLASILDQFGLDFGAPNAFGDFKRN